MRAMNIKDRVRKIIAQQRTTLQEEIEDLKKRQMDEMQAMGCGGAYNRKETAILKRYKQLDELDDMESQLRAAKRHEKVELYAMQCRECGNIILSYMQPSGQWSECPHCKKMMYAERLRSKEMQVVDDGSGWMQSLKNMMKED